MAQYIDKDVLVAKIEGIIDILEKNSGYNGIFGDSQMAICEEILSIIDTLEVKASNSLTWVDMMLIHRCCKDAMNNNLYAWQTAAGQQKIYEDVLKRFKAQKEE